MALRAGRRYASPIDRPVLTRLARTWPMRCCSSRNAVLRAVLLPLLGLGYLFSYIDRTNVGYAALEMNGDIGLTATSFGLAAGIFYIGHCLLEVPSNLALVRFGARCWLSRIMIS
jgi:sugar phosphate permease